MASVPMSESVEVTPVDGVEVTVAMDNAIDILAAPTERASRQPWRSDWNEGDQLRAEHGYSLSVTVHRNGGADKILYDAGLTRESMVHNLDVLGLNPRDYRAVVLSHGHADHHGGLEGLFGRICVLLRSSTPRSPEPIAGVGLMSAIWEDKIEGISRSDVKRCGVMDLCSNPIQRHMI